MPQLAQHQPNADIANIRQSILNKMPHRIADSILTKNPVRKRVGMDFKLQSTNHLARHTNTPHANFFSRKRKLITREFFGQEVFLDHQ
ncbi:MAG: hypothetical protein WC802_00460 [Patescibacteria group bacterium]